jgi:ERCC4-type nuclease
VDPDLFFEELTGRLLFNYFAQPHKLIYALIWLHITFTFKIVHRRSADRTVNYLVLIEHRKLNDHPIEVEAPHLASPQRHCEFSTLKKVIVPR